MIGDGPAHALEVAVQDLHEHGRLHALTERGEADQIGEESGDLLALSTRRNAARDDPLDHLAGDETREGRLQGLEVGRGGLTPLSQSLNLSS